jgi:hypothetical protein
LELKNLRALSLLIGKEEKWMKKNLGYM